MKPTRKYIHKMEFRIKGIPCIIAVSYFHRQHPSGGCARSCDNDMDYYGYTEIEYDVLDRRGHTANWLANKIDDDTDREIKNQIESDLR